MRLADQLLAAVGSRNDAGLVGAISSLAASLARAECFEMSNDLRSACSAVSKSKPSSVVSALPMTRLPYAKTWVEWLGGEFDPDRDPATDTRPAPTRMGCLLEAHDESLSHGRMNWAWSHAANAPVEIMICPYSFVFDWRAGADLTQQIRAILETELSEVEKNRRLAAAGFVADVVSMTTLVQWWSASSADASAVMRHTKKWAHLAANPTEQKACLQLERHGILQPSIYCSGLWSEAPSLPNFEVRRRAWLDDIEGEVPFVQAFFAMMNAKGAIAAQKDDLARLNKSRARLGKQALREFVVTRLNLSKGTVNRAGARGMSREAARMHLVRGHFKVRKTGIYWWSPFPRGRGDVARRERYEVANR